MSLGDLFNKDQTVQGLNRSLMMKFNYFLTIASSFLLKFGVVFTFSTFDWLKKLFTSDEPFLFLFIADSTFSLVLSFDPSLTTKKRLKDKKLSLFLLKTNLILAILFQYKESLWFRLVTPIGTVLQSGQNFKKAQNLYVDLAKESFEIF